jgi:hypothetical protein
VLLERLGEEDVGGAFASFDDIYEQESGVSPLSEVAERLAAAAPADLARVDLSNYRALRPPWNEWAYVAARGRHWAERLARIALEEQS